MPNRNNARRQRRRGGQQSATKAVLERIEENTRAEIEKAPPQVRDKIPMALSSKKVHTFKRSYNAGGITTSTSGTSFGVFQITLDNFDTTSEFAENFQFYRIIELSFKFIPTMEMTTALTTTNGGNYGNFYTVIDYRNASTPISIAELEQYISFQVVRTGQFVRRTFTPRTLGRCFGGVTDAFYLMPAGTWLSTEFTDAVYYGVKYATGQGVNMPNGQVVYSVSVEAVIQCKSTL